MKNIVLIIVSILLTTAISKEVEAEVEREREVDTTTKLSYSVELWSGALATFQDNSGLKGSANGVFLGSLNYNFNPKLWTTTTIRAAYGFDTPLIETAIFGVKAKKLSVEAGLISSRYGKLSFYRTQFTTSPFFDKATIWDSYGFGAMPKLSFNKSNSLALTLTLNERETGVANLWYQLKKDITQANIYVGIQSGDMQTQDIQFTSGFDISAGGDIISGKLIGGYTHSFGYGSETNGTIKAYDYFSTILEGTLTPTNFLSYSSVLSYNLEKRESDYDEWIIGNSIKVYPFKFGGPTATVEIFPNSVLSTTQEYKFDFTPLKEKVLFSLGYRREKTDIESSSSVTNSVVGYVWFKI